MFHILGIAAFLLLSLILEFIATFTKYWVVDNRGMHCGIVPFNSPCDLTVIALLCLMAVLMYGSLTLFALVMGVFVWTSIKVQRHGYQRHCRKLFYILILLAFFTAVCEAAAFTVGLLAYTYHDSRADYRTNIGYSGYLAATSAALMLPVMGWSGYVAVAKCR